GVLAVVAGELWATQAVERAERKRWTTGRTGSGVGATAGGAGRRGPGSGIGRPKPGVPPLHFTSPAAWSMTQTKASWEATNDSLRPSFPGAPAFLSSAIDSLFSLISRDFVLKWYSTLSDSPAFPNAVERTMRDAVLKLANRVGDVDWSDVLVGRILPLLTAHLDAFRAAEQSLRRQDLRADLTESDEHDLFLASRYAAEIKSNKLHEAVDVASPNSKPAEEAWLRSLFGQILPLIVPERELDSPAVKVMVREIVACAVMLPIFDMLGDPDFWNRIIDDKAGSAIRDQKMVNQFREALDRQSPAVVTASLLSFMAPPKPQAPRRTETISVRTSPKQFDSWMQGISRCRSLADAKRLRSDVTAQIRKAKGLTDGQNLDDVVEGVKVADWIDYIERLYSAKRKVDKRIAQLGGGTASTQPSYATTVHNPQLLSAFRLRDILLNPESLSYFMEFQERRKASLRVQFWLLVEGLKDPLEHLGDDIQSTVSAAPDQAKFDVALDDIKLIWSLYLDADPFGSSEGHLQTVRAFVERSSDEPLTAQDVRRVRHAIFAIQNDVLVAMEEEDFPGFVNSDLYFRAVSDLPLPSGPSTPTLASASTLPFVPLPPPRRRSSPSNLPAAPSHVSPPPSNPPASPPPPAIQSSRSESPIPTFSGPNRPLHLQRTDTAPPQVTFYAAIDSAKMRRTGSDSGLERSPTRKASAGSLDSQPSIASAGMRRKSGPLSDSLDFLMSSPTRETDRRLPLFGAEGGPDQEDQPIDGSPGSDDDYIQVQTIEAIQEALDSILETDARAPTQLQKSSSLLTSPPDASTSSTAVEQRKSGDNQARPLPPPKHPSLSASTSVSVISNGRPEPLVQKRTVFGDEETLDDVDLEDNEPDFDPQSVRLAAPGDLHLPDEIARLAASLDKLKSQEAVVGALIRKAELTGNASELKILVKSRDSLRREIRAAKFQKDQYESQESENKITPDRTSVTVPGTTVGQAGGQSFQLYLVEVHQLHADGSFRSGWIVTRRYSEFAALHAKLRDKYVAVRYLDFPGKRLVVASQNKEFIEQRRAGLQRPELTYRPAIQALIKIPVVCRGEELRAFLSQQTITLPKSVPDRKGTSPLAPGQGFMRTFYRSVTSGIDDVLGTSTTSMMDTIIERLSQQATEFAGIGGNGIRDEDLVEQVLAGGEGRMGEEGLTYFTAPICDLFVTIFELREKNNWLRRQAILIVLQQVLGGTIERKFRDSVKMLLAPPQLVTYINSLKNGLWPDGELKPKVPPRTPEEKAATKDSANRKLSALMPGEFSLFALHLPGPNYDIPEDVAANLIGRHNARQGARRLFAALQNRRLNKHLIYSISDEVCAVLFPELASRTAAAAGPAVPVLPTVI
ncbi:SPOSA6832_03111, partial [Sporobolomyces salmonicolor]